MKLKELLARTEYEVVEGSDEVEIDTLINDSRKAAPGAVFVCIPGAKSDGHNYAADVAAKGAAALIVERKLPIDGITQILVKDSRVALAEASAAYFGYPAEKMTTIGITGTKGKTTTTYMVRSILELSGIPTGLIGTIETIIGDEVIPSVNTTPESYKVQEYFRKMVDKGIKCVVMEVSSQALMQHRVGGITFDYGIFTNLSEDHIGPNEHKDFEDYKYWKSTLFQNCKVGIFNADDTYFEDISALCSCKIETFGLSEKCDLRASDLSLVRNDGKLGVHYCVSGMEDMEVELNMPGKFSVYNSLTAIAICHHFGVEKKVIQKALSEVQVKGRVEMVPVSDRYTLIIDYAHMAEALKSVLTTLREYDNSEHPFRLVTLFGCGGDRARERRFGMGEVSSNLSDLTVVTSDNPRTEKPEAIIADIIEGVKRGPGKYVTIPDRKEAIRYCMMNAQDGDVIILAGKGHETYQEINGVKYDMDERVLIREIMEEEGLIRA